MSNDKNGDHPCLHFLIFKSLYRVFLKFYCCEDVVHTFHLIIDHFIQPLIDVTIHVVPFRDLTPFVFSFIYYSITLFVKVSSIELCNNECVWCSSNGPRRNLPLLYICALGFLTTCWEHLALAEPIK